MLSVRYPEIPEGCGGSGYESVGRRRGFCAKPQRNGEPSEFHGAGVSRCGAALGPRLARGTGFPTGRHGPRARIAPPRRDLAIRGAKEGILWQTTKGWRAVKLPRGRVVARVGVGFAVSYRNRISDPTLFGGPTARIAPPRRDLPIRRAEAWIAKGLPRVCSFLRRDQPEGFNEDPTSPISV